jgi:signal transduction histidine kinase
MTEDDRSNQSIEDEIRRRNSELERECRQKSQDLMDSESRLIQAEKLVALGNLVAGLAHEIYTPLGAVSNNNEVFELGFRKVSDLISQLRQAGPGSDTQAADLEELLAIIKDSIRTNRLACERLIRIVRSVRTFARLDEGEWKKADIHEGIECSLTLLGHELKSRIAVVKDFGDIHPLECFPNQLNQVFMNILTNAVQAIDGKGEIRIRTEQNGGEVIVSISDNGSGISPENLRRIFEPGFTTKKPGVGTGLGLSICSKIIENHNGRIEVESKPGQGSTFRIILPIARPHEGS